MKKLTIAILLIVGMIIIGAHAFATTADDVRIQETSTIDVSSLVGDSGLAGGGGGIGGAVGGGGGGAVGGGGANIDVAQY